MGVRFSFEGNSVYQEAMSFAYACLRRAHGFPPSYQVYGEALRSRALSVGEEVAIALSHANATTPPNFDPAMAHAIACVPIIDLATTAGIMRESERDSLRMKLSKLLEYLELKAIPLSIRTKEEAK